MKRTSPANLPPLSFPRQPYYCEENAWHLCQESFFEDRPRHVVFISNIERAVPMWNQRAGNGKPIVWDYHVIVIGENPVEVWDVDTLLDMPMNLADYLAGSFHPEMPECFQPCFRVVSAEQYVEVFASDRSHMRRANGSFRKPPPNWPLITRPGLSSNLMDFVAMDQDFVGDVLTLDELRKRFA